MAVEIDRSRPVLVTGGGGYIASWVVRELLAEALPVRATVRSMADAKKVSHLLELGAAYPGMLQLFEADLLVEGSFDEATRGCQIVMHTALPFLDTGWKDAQKELVDPAFEGTRNVLESANRAGTVQRIVLTSSVAAIMGDAIDADQLPDRSFNESHWNTTSSLEHNPYPYSKTVAEREAWKICEAQNNWDLVTINPAFVLGPSLSRRADGTSVGFMKSMAGGDFRFGVPDLNLGVVDVRDVARAYPRQPEARRERPAFDLRRNAEHRGNGFDIARSPRRSLSLSEKYAADFFDVSGRSVHRYDLGLREQKHRHALSPGSRLQRERSGSVVQAGARYARRSY